MGRDELGPLVETRPATTCRHRSEKFTMFNPLKTLLANFFLPAGASSAMDDSRSLQLATAVLLVEVMRSDARFNPQERAATVAALHTQFTLTDEELARLLTQAEHTAQVANDYFGFTSAMNDHYTQAQKIMVVELMWQVAYADGHLDANENHVISKVAGLLHVTHGEYIAAKLYAKQAATLRD